MSTRMGIIYVGRNLKDLNTLAADIPRINSAELFIGTAEQVFNKAQQYYKKGDEEMAYVFYMRYFNILTTMKKASDYKRTEEKIGKVLGADKSQHAIDQAEKLAKSLQARYAELDALALHRKMASMKVNKEVRRMPERSKSEKVPSGSGKARRPAQLSRAKSQEDYTYLEPL